MAEAVLLEWEGVLADTRRARRDALRRAMAAEGIAHRLSDDDEQVRGLGVRGAVRVMLRQMGLTDATLAELLEVRACREFAATLAHGLVLAPGALAFVARLQSRARVAMVTRSSREECDVVLRLAGLEHAVSVIVCADSLPNDELPSPAGYRRAVERLRQLQPHAATRPVAVVDGAPSIRAARRAGVRVIAVGVAPDEAMDADALAASLDDVLPDVAVSARDGASRVQRA